MWIVLFVSRKHQHRRFGAKPACVDYLPAFAAPLSTCRAASRWGAWADAISKVIAGISLRTVFYSSRPI